jgi:hypothetical protein
MGTGAIAAPVAGLVGLTNLPFGQERAAGLTESYQRGLTYEPRTEQGQAQMRAIAWPFTKLSELAQKGSDLVFELTGSPGLATETNVALQALPFILSKGARGPVQRIVGRRQQQLAGERSAGAVFDETRARAEAEGYTFPPEGWAAERLMSIGGKAAVGQELALRNQKVTNTIARREAGLRPNEPISRATLKEARTRIEEPYREVARLSPDAKTALEQLKQARYEARQQHNFADRSGNPQARAEGRRLTAEAEAWEQILEQEAQKLGRPELVPRLREARQASAKNRLVDEAVNVGSGDVDAQVIGRHLDRGDPLTGGLETIGRLAQSAKAITREASGIPTPGVSKAEALAAGMFGLMGQQTGMGLFAAGLPLVSSPARRIALSKLMASRPNYKPGLSYNLADIATARPEVLALTPTLSRPPEREQPPWWSNFREAE